MTWNITTLPYGYENEEDPIQLPNGMTRQQVWAYTIEMLGANGIVEGLTRTIIYRAGAYCISSGTQYEWRYRQQAEQVAVADGYRQYEIGELLRDDEPFLEPEVAVVLAYTPEPGVLPPFIEMLDLDSVETLMKELGIISDDDRTLNAWMMPPIDAPRIAPADISSTLSQMRRELGLQVRRGRAHAIIQAMRVAGVIVADTGWALTAEEASRRRRAVAG